MSQVTQRSATLSPYGRSTEPDLPPKAAWFFEGVLAAGLGLGSLAVLVLLLWIISPYPESGAGGALHIAADLWLLGHGSSLVRTDTLSGVPAPIALTPLLLAIPPVWLLYRACVQALAHGGEPSGDEDPKSETGSAPADGAGREPMGPLTPLVFVAGGYLLTGAVTVLFASGGPVRADALSALVRLPLFVLCVVAATLWPLGGDVPPEPGRQPGTEAADASVNSHDGSAGSARAAGSAPEAAAARRRLSSLVPYDARLLARRLPRLRTVLTATAVLFGGGLLITLGALLWHVDDVRAAFPRLAGDSWTGQFAVLLLVVALLPNAAVWAAAYVLGPGFALGGGSSAGLLVDGDATGLPPFPLLEALPAQAGGHGFLTSLAAGTVPLAAAATVGWYVAHAAVPEPGRAPGAASRQGTVWVVALVACEIGAGVAALAALSGGALGTEAMAFLGPNWWLTGGAACAWTLLVGAPVALAVRSWRLRGRGPDDDWHQTLARRARWAELKTASGGLMPDFEPRRD
ncbi:cell division protein PerM [Streptomyces marispadix]|uniref:DUF6350 family protein n=1 Tax=Streptomyces marispadix TaxID=2922868 RepID=A0ABS9T0Y0_9ACTN|nr:DUF6350 family protein [Streptomyces marispadix]MCH6162157.1 DUF6350 family protein [Streptomyces marispadix]